MVRERERKRRDLNHLSVHQWLRSAIRDSQQPTSPIGFLFLKLPPPPCAVLLVLVHFRLYFMHMCIWIWMYACAFADIANIVMQRHRTIHGHSHSAGALGHFDSYVSAEKQKTEHNNTWVPPWTAPRTPWTNWNLTWGLTNPHHSDQRACRRPYHSRTQLQSTTLEISQDWNE